MELYELGGLILLIINAVISILYYIIGSLESDNYIYKSVNFGRANFHMLVMVLLLVEYSLITS